MSFGRSAQTGDVAPELPGWRHVYTGKVREVYESADDPGILLIVASDRVSAFDHILSPAIPGKGAMLTRLTRHWVGELGLPSHLREPDGWDAGLPEELAARSMRVARLEMLPIECVVRGYLTGSGWKEYRASGTVCGIALPEGLSDGDRLPEPIYTPAFKAEQGDHDENISYERSVELVGEEAARALRDRSLELYRRAAAIAEAKGVILADTKLEWGRDRETGEITLGDEVLTSDSSRYWDGAAYADETLPLAKRLASFDKQIVRDWLSANWDGEGTPPELPAEIVATTQARYRELFTRLGIA
ncbi:Phosphoribosylaminoimidazole-succinocarboxamide synthase [Pseudoclavibacter triregionum]|nr:Phosphoribosylaminoimidazole-succinocarboxamide synthase [Pseudoclavibacter triregionum]